MKEAESGSVGLQFLVVLLFVAAVASAAAAAAGAASRYERRSLAAAGMRAALEAAARERIKLLLADTSPESDSRADPFWNAPQVTEDGVTLTVRDASSGLNANFVRKNVFQKTSLSRLLLPGKDAADLQQFREDKGLSLSREAYAAFFTEEALSTSVVVHGWANINVSDEFALRSLFGTATGTDTGAEAFHGKVQALLREGLLVQRVELDAFLGFDRDALYPLINAEPSMNVNFVDPFVLRELLAYPDYALPEASGKAEALIALRDGDGINPAELTALLGPECSPVLKEYFGCRTWFWEVTARKDGRELSLVVARYPDGAAGTGSGPRLAIVETRMRP